MRVLHLIFSFGGGGAEKQLSLLAPAMVRAGIDIHVGYCQRGSNFENIEDAGLALHHIPHGRTSDPRMALDVFKLVSAVKPDIVQTWLPLMDVVGGGVCIMLGIPLIVSERSSEQGYARHWKTTLRVQIGRRARCIVANSEGGADYWRSNLPRGRVHVVRNCLQPSAHPAAVEREPVTPSIDDVLVLFAGRFSYEKNIAVLVESLLLVVRQHPTAHVLMFGDGPERDAVAQLVDREGMQERIKLKGYARDLFSWMKRAAVCISVSRFEGHPNVPIEAAHAGCPLVLSDIPSHREVFGDDSALIVSKDSPGQIADSVLDVLSNVSAARRRASRARLAVAALDITTAITAYLAVYNSVIADATRSAPRG